MSLFRQAANLCLSPPGFAPCCDQAQEAAERARRALAAPGSGSIAAGQQSDHLLMVAAVDGWLAARRQDGPQGAWLAAYC